MLNAIKKIMEKSKAENVDIIVAHDMLINEGEDKDAMKKALDIYTKSYEEISELKVANDWDNLEKVVKLTEEKKYEEIRELMKEIRGE